MQNKAKYKKLTENIDNLKNSGIIIDIPSCNTTESDINSVTDKYSLLSSSYVGKQDLYYYVKGVDAC